MKKLFSMIGTALLVILNITQTRNSLKIAPSKAAMSEATVDSISNCLPGNQ